VACGSAVLKLAAVIEALPQVRSVLHLHLALHGDVNHHSMMPFSAAF
jgi:hypothetical protein